MQRLYFNALVLLLLVFFWAAQAQTVGHIYIYVTLCVASLAGLKLVLPYAWLLIILCLV